MTTKQEIPITTLVQDRTLEPETKDILEYVIEQLQKENYNPNDFKLSEIPIEDVYCFERINKKYKGFYGTDYFVAEKYDNKFIFSHIDEKSYNCTVKTIEESILYNNINSTIMELNRPKRKGFIKITNKKIMTNIGFIDIMGIRLKIYNKEDLYNAYFDAPYNNGYVNKMKEITKVFKEKEISEEVEELMYIRYKYVKNNEIYYFTDFKNTYIARYNTEKEEFYVEIT